MRLGQLERERFFQKTRGIRGIGGAEANGICGADRLPAEINRPRPQPAATQHKLVVVLRPSAIDQHSLVNRFEFPVGHDHVGDILSLRGKKVRGGKRNIVWGRRDVDPLQRQRLPDRIAITPVVATEKIAHFHHHR